MTKKQIHHFTELYKVKFRNKNRIQTQLSNFRVMSRDSLYFFLFLFFASMFTCLETLEVMSLGKVLYASRLDLETKLPYFFI